MLGTDAVDSIRLQRGRNAAKLAGSRAAPKHGIVRPMRSKGDFDWSSGFAQHTLIRAMAPAMSAGHRALAYRIAVLASTCLGSVSCVVVVAHMREKWRARQGDRGGGAKVICIQPNLTAG